MALSTFTSITFLSIFNFVFFCAGIFLNSVVIISIQRSSQLRNKLCYFTIFLLSCADFIVVIIVHPSIAWITYSQLHGGKYEVHKFIITDVFYIAQSFSIVMLPTLNVERFLAIKFPFFHQMQVTKKRLTVFAAFLECLVVLLKSLVWLDVLRSTIFICLPLTSITLVYLNFEMYKIARSKERRIATTISKSNGRENYPKKMPTFFVVVCLMVFLLPRAALSFYTSISLTSTFDNMAEVHLHLWSNTIMVMNSSFNCLAFFWKNSLLRREGLKIVWNCTLAKCYRS